MLRAVALTSDSSGRAASMRAITSGATPPSGSGDPANAGSLTSPGRGRAPPSPRRPFTLRDDTAPATSPRAPHGQVAALAQALVCRRGDAGRPDRARSRGDRQARDPAV